jgi:hypothetical protein
MVLANPKGVQCTELPHLVAWRVWEGAVRQCFLKQVRALKAVAYDGGKPGCQRAAVPAAAAMQGRLLPCVCSVPRIQQQALQIEAAAVCRRGGEGGRCHWL